MKIKKAKISDARSIARVHVASWHGTYKGIMPDEYIEQLSVEKRAAAWIKFVADPKEGCIYVATEDKHIVAFASAGPARDQGLDFRGELYSIYADPDFIRSGVGKLLFARCVDNLEQRGYSSFYCWVLVDNKLGRDFYERVGGEIVGGQEKTIGFAGKKLKEIMYSWIIH